VTDPTLIDKPRLLAVIEQTLKRRTETAELTHLKQLTDFAARQDAPYKIAIITALPKEAAAVRAVFGDGLAIPSANRSAVEFREITCAEISGQNVHRLLLCQSIQMGNNSAAVAAACVLSEYPNVQDIILLGIAGGIPNMEAARQNQSHVEDHVRKGDIVISEQVLQYDFMKLEEHHSENRARPRPPSARLLRAVNELEQGMSLGQRPWESVIADVGQRYNWRPPRVDVLYDFSGPAPIKLRHPNNRRSGAPYIHRGIIGSANILLKSHSARDVLHAINKVRAVEMEASGVADAAWSFAAGYLAVRGICDYCDKSKDNKWQAYAALVAAALARSIIERVPV
jgi:nucleoside phosphorylase